MDSPRQTTYIRISSRDLERLQGIPPPPPKHYLPYGASTSFPNPAYKEWLRKYGKQGQLLYGF